VQRLRQDFRFAIRSLGKSPVFTVVALLSIAFGIGANTAIFSLIDQVILRSLPVKDPGRLVLLYRDGSNYGNNRGDKALSYPMYQDFRDQNSVFDGVMCRYQGPLSFSANGSTERISGELVSGNYFQVLGVNAALGRLFTPADNQQEGGHPVAVLSYHFWRNRFAGDPNVVGRQIKLNDYPITIVGVSAETFDGIDPAFSPDVRVPMMMKKVMTPGWDDLKNRRSTWVNVFARLKPGVTPAAAQAEMNTIFHRILQMEVKEKDFANSTPYVREQFLKANLKLQPAANGKSGLRDRFSKPLWILMAVVGFVLLIACANVANLMIARASSRQKEIAVRLAMGARRAHIVQQLLIESLLLSLAGAVAGTLLAMATVRILLSFVPSNGRDLALSAAPDLRVFLFALGVAVLSALLFGLLPALQATRSDVARTLKNEATNLSGGGSQVSFRKILVVAQVSLSLLLLIGAGLFIKSLRNLKQVNPGFRPSNLIAFDTDPTLNNYPPGRTHQMYRELLAKLRSTPGVQNAGAASVRILQDNEWDSTISVEGYEAKPGEDMQAFVNRIEPGYFATLGIPLLEGRDFSLRDVGNEDTVAIVNRSFVEHYFGKQSAIGKHIGFGGNPGTKLKMEIIGVIADAKYTALRDNIQRQLFVPAEQAKGGLALTTFVRTTLPSEQMFSVIRGQMRGIDSNVPVYGMKTIESQLDENLLQERLVAGLSSVFGILATLLAVIGLYGVMAYTVLRRTREIGIRMAIGAVRGNVLWLVMKEVLVVIAAGIALGAPVALLLTRFVRSQLYELEPTDLETVLLAVGTLFVVGCIAGYVPAMKASRIDPLRALRYE
jgi:predicted permease